MPQALEVAPDTHPVRGVGVRVQNVGHWGLDADGETVVFEESGLLPTTDGRFLIGVRQPGPSDPGPTCIIEVATGDVSCYEDQLTVREPWAVGGHLASGVTRLSDEATVVYLEPTAAFDGQLVHVWGHDLATRRASSPSVARRCPRPTSTSGAIAISRFAWARHAAVLRSDTVVLEPVLLHQARELKSIAQSKRPPDAFAHAVMLP